MKWTIRFLLLFVCCWWGWASADDYYYWTASVPSASGMQFASAYEACEYVYTASSSDFQNPFYLNFSSDRVGYCRTKYGGNPGYQIATLTRNGHSCPPDTEYNSETGGCDAPPNQCEDTNGQTVSHEHKIKEAVGQPYIEPPSTVCANSCQYSWGYTAATNVYVYSSGTPSGVFGVYSYTGNGIQCTGDTRKEPGDPSQQTNPDDTPPPDPDNNCPDGYIYNGTFCSPEQPTDPDEPTDPDDPDDPGDDDGDGDGDGPGDGDGDGSGEGDGDGDGDGSGGGNGDGDGEGDGQCDPATDPNKCEKSSVTGEACEAEIKCTGDAVQCAILRQQKELRCHAEEQADFEKHESAIEAAVTGDRFQLDEGSGVIDVPSFINQGTRFLPSACPAAESFSLTTAGGSTFQLSYEPLCRAASDLSGLFVAVATVLAALYVGRGVGGQ